MAAGSEYTYTSLTSNSLHAMEADYLKGTVGSCLAAGLAEVAAKRPSDPIEYLALWMLEYKQNTLDRKREGVSRNCSE